MLYLRCSIWNRQGNRVSLRAVQVSSPKNTRSSNVHRSCGRAKLILGDLNAAGIDEVVTQIRKSGGFVVQFSARNFSGAGFRMFF